MTSQWLPWRRFTPPPAPQTHPHRDVTHTTYKTHTHTHQRLPLTKCKNCWIKLNRTYTQKLTRNIIPCLLCSHVMHCTPGAEPQRPTGARYHWTVFSIHISPIQAYITSLWTLTQCGLQIPHNIVDFPKYCLRQSVLDQIITSINVVSSLLRSHKHIYMPFIQKHSWYQWFISILRLGCWLCLVWWKWQKTIKMYLKTEV